MSFNAARLREALGHDEPRDHNAKAPCQWCKRSTPVTVLNHLGARCEGCFAAYCKAPPPPAKPPRPITRPAASIDSAASHLELPQRVPLPALDLPPVDVEREYFGEQDHDPNPLPASAAGP